jgi:putative ABC transport system ATP-binding protein
MEVINALGRRKAAVARVFVSEGSGKITINKRDLEVYFPSPLLQYVVKQPLNKLGVAEKYDIKVNLDGGGFKGQSEALRLAIARALVNNPAVILADEATGNLDTRTSFEILVLFQKLHAEGRTIIFVTHNPEIAQYSSRNIRLRDGHVIEDTVNTHVLSAAEALAALPKSDED